MDWKLEVVQVPVSDPDASIAFYTEKVGFALDLDHRISDDLRFIQITPPGSACSIVFGTGLTDATPGSVKGLQVVISDADQAYAELAARGLETSEIQSLPWGRFISFEDPDGNSWSLQESPNRVNPPA